MPKHDMIVASSNPHKLTEFRQILDPTQWNVLSLKDVGFTAEIPETGQTFAENSAQKAMAIAQTHPDAWIVADDSGFCIDCLEGRPGIHSARFLGDADYPTKIARLIAEASEICPDPTQRTAHFHCAIVLKQPEVEALHTFEATWDGLLAETPRGTHGFGYDPALYLPDLGCTAAELEPAMKHTRSHRGQALHKMHTWLLENGWSAKETL